MFNLFKEKNMNNIKKYWPNIYNQIKDIILNEDLYRLSSAKNVGAPIVEVKVNERWNPLYSKYNPYEEAENWAQSIDSNPKHIILFSFGLGYHYLALKTKFPQVRFHIIEPEPQLFLLYSASFNIETDHFNNVDHFLIPKCQEDFQKLSDEIVRLVDESWLFLSPPKFQKAFLDSYRLFEAAFKKSKEQILNVAVSQRLFQKTWNFNALRNLPKIHQTPNIFNYKEQFQGKTVILTASGPSLNETVPFIKHIQKMKKAMIIAAGTSVNALLAKEIEPDLLVSYDPMIANYNALQGVLNKDIPLVFGSTIFPQIIDEYKGPLANMITSQDMITKYRDPELEKEQIIQDAPTITAVAIDLLNKLGVKEVYLAGQDLCFIDEKVGAEGVYYYNKNGKLDDQQLKHKDYVENNNGESALTNQSFLIMKDFIENVIGNMDGKMTVHSLSLYGAKINGMPYCSIKEAEEKISQQHPIDVDFSFNTNVTENHLLEDFRKINEEVNFYTEIYQTLQRQIIKYHSASPNQKGKWISKIDQSFGHIALRPSFQQIIYPIVANRINLMFRMKNNLNLNNDRERDDYYNNGLFPLVEELKVGLDEYNKILLDIKNRNINTLVS